MEETLTKKQLLERKGELARELFDKMESDHRKSRTRQLCIHVIGWALAVLGVVLSVYGSVIAEKQAGFGGLWAVLWGPGNIQTIPLSNLLRIPVLAGERREGEGRQLEAAKKKVYVFGLDMSGSLADRISKDDWDYFEARVTSDGLSKCEGAKFQEGVTSRWHLMQAQTCCYLQSLRNGDAVRIWEFGDTASLIEGASGELREVDRSMPEQDRIIKLLLSHKAPGKDDSNFHLTNFEGLLDGWHLEYFEDSSYEEDELHFVIVSDFVHDIGDKGELAYATSIQRIGDRFRGMGARRAMFHLVNVSSGNSEVNSVMKALEESSGWYEYRRDSFRRPATRAKSMPEFFYGFSEATESLVFYHMVGTSTAAPVRLIWEDGLGEGVTIGFMTDAYGASDQDLAVFLATGWNGKRCQYFGRSSLLKGSDSSGGEVPDTAVLRSSGRRAFVVDRPGDHICVQPLAVERERLYNYKLTLSLAGSEAQRTTYIVDVEFQEYLPPLATWTLMACVLAVLGAVAVLLVAERWGSIGRNKRMHGGIGSFSTSLYRRHLERSQNPSEVLSD